MRRFLIWLSTLAMGLATLATAQVTPPSGSGVTAINGKKGAITLAAGTGVTITPSGNTLTVAATSGSGDITDVNITTTAPITGGANCATGACSFTLGISSATFAIMAAQTSADLAAVLSDEVGTTGGFIRATSATASRIAVLDANSNITANGALTSNALPRAASSGATLADSGVSDDGTNVSLGSRHFTVEGVTSTGATGTGKLVFDTSPVFTTSISTPAIVSATNATTINTAVATNTTVANDNSTNFLTITGTMPTTPSATVYGVYSNITGAGSASQAQFGLFSGLAAGYTGSSRTTALLGSNSSAGTGATISTTLAGNVGTSGSASNSVAGAINIGVYGLGTNSNASHTVAAYGTLGIGNGSKHAVGVGGFTNLGSTTDIAGYFSSGFITPPAVKTTLVANNGSQAVPIFGAYDNSSAVFTIQDGGNVVQGSGLSLTNDNRISTAGVTLAESATAPAQITTAQAGSAVTVNASDAVAGSSVAGAAAGGGITLTSGAAARLSSGNANGGNITLATGAGIGTGKAGYYVFNAGATTWNLLVGLANNQTVWTSSVGTNTTATNSMLFGFAGANAVTGTNNTSFGVSAATGWTSGANNVAFGANAGNTTTAETNGLTPVANTTGGSNTYLGQNTGGTANNQDRTFMVGKDARASASDMGVLGGKTVATFQLGSDSSDTQSARVLRAAGARASTDTDTAASPLTIAGGIATGTGKSGDVRIQTAPAGSTGTTAQTLSDRAVFAAKQVTLTESSATLVLNVGVASNTVAGGTLRYTIRADDATDYQAIRGTVEWSAVNKGGTVTVMLGTPTEVTTTSSGTLTNTTTAVANGSSVDFKLNAVSSLTQTTLYAYVSGQLDGTGVFTTQ